METNQKNPNALPDSVQANPEVDPALTAGGRAGRNLAAILALGIIFLGVSSIIKPDPRGATASPNRAVALPAQTPETRTQGGTGTVLSTLMATPSERLGGEQGWKLVGGLEGKTNLVLIHADLQGVSRYSVFTLEGVLLKGGLRGDEVYRSFPELDVPNLQADPPSGGAGVDGAIMYAEPGLVGPSGPDGQR